MRPKFITIFALYRVFKRCFGRELGLLFSTYSLSFHVILCVGVEEKKMSIKKGQGWWQKKPGGTVCNNIRDTLIFIR